MKTLYLLRHAKSSSANPGCKDFDRPLSKRGLNDVPVMASRFKERKFSVQLMISSSAKRAQATAGLMAKNIGFPVEDIISNSELYFAGTEMFLRVVSLLDENCESAMLVGHNPTITDFANCMTNKGIDNVPTCGLIKMSLTINYWSDIVLGKGTFLEFDYPKKLR